MKITYIAVLLSLVVAGVFGVFFSHFLAQEKNSSVLHEQSASLASLLPTEADVSQGMSAESIAIFAQNVPGDIQAVPVTPIVSQPITPPVVELQSATVPLQSVSNAAPVTYIYFYTGVPVRPVNTGGLMPVGQVSIASVPIVPPAPVVRSYTVPIFFPQVVPSRVGAPRLVYTNGVVIKPKVYYPHQPLRNSLRGVTP